MALVSEVWVQKHQPVVSLTARNGPNIKTDDKTVIKLLLILRILSVFEIP